MSSRGSLRIERDGIWSSFVSFRLISLLRFTLVILLIRSRVYTLFCISFCIFFFTYWPAKAEKKEEKDCDYLTSTLSPASLLFSSSLLCCVLCVVGRGVQWETIYYLLLEFVWTSSVWKCEGRRRFYALCSTCLFRSSVDKTHSIERGQQIFYLVHWSER